MRWVEGQQYVFGAASHFWKAEFKVPRLVPAFALMNLVCLKDITLVKQPQQLLECHVVIPHIQVVGFVSQIIKFLVLGLYADSLHDVWVEWEGEPETYQKLLIDGRVLVADEQGPLVLRHDGETILFCARGAVVIERDLDEGLPLIVELTLRHQHVRFGLDLGEGSL
jgi:hypothetical protein